MIPMNGAPGIRTFGNCGDTANPFAISQWTMYGSGNRSRKNPKPGMITVKPVGGVMTSSI